MTRVLEPVEAVDDAYGDSLMSSVVRYYERTWFDYRYVWMTRANIAFHFGYYDATHTRHVEALTNTNRMLADLAQVVRGTRVLDAGCGLGGSAIWLATTRGARVIGITPVEQHVGQARRLAAERACDDRVSFECRDYRQTGFPDGSFDVVWALESLCHAEDKAPFYREAARLLRPGGRLVIADYMRAGRPLSARDESVIARWLAGWAIPDIDTRDEHIAAATAAGLDAIEVRDFTPCMRRSSRRLYKLSRIAIPINRIWHALGWRCAVQYANVIASRLQYEALQSGSWFYGVLTARKE